MRMWAASVRVGEGGSLGGGSSTRPWVNGPLATSAFSKDRAAFFCSEPVTGRIGGS